MEGRRREGKGGVNEREQRNGNKGREEKRKEE